MPDVTHMLHMAREDQPGAADRLWREVYDELKRMAAARIAAESRPALLQATGLVHEAWMRMSGPGGETRTWHSRAHFFGAAAEAMRRILVDQARQRLSAKRGGGLEAVPLEEAGEISGPSDERTLQIHELLGALEQENPKQAELVKLRFFAGLSHTEIGALLDISERTVRREWTLAKTWLFQSLSEKTPDPAGEV